MKQYILLLRPVNVAITAASIYVSCLLAGGTEAQLLAMVTASLGGALIGGGGMVINDFFDIAIDKINKPHRPLASGAIAKFDALMFYAAVTGAGLIMSAYSTKNAFIIAFAAVPVIFLYSQRFKSTPLFGNILVGALTGLAFIYGGAAVGNIQQAVMPAVFAFLINVGREIIKDMEDVEGDARNNARTFPVLYGMRKSALLASLFLSAVILSTVIPFVIGLYSARFFIVVNVGVNAVIVFVLFSLWKNQSSKNLNLLSTILKWDMLVGLVAIYVN